MIVLVFSAHLAVVGIASLKSTTKTEAKLFFEGH